MVSQKVSFALVITGYFSYCRYAANRQGFIMVTRDLMLHYCTDTPETCLNLFIMKHVLSASGQLATNILFLGHFVVWIELQPFKIIINDGFSSPFCNDFCITCILCEKGKYY